MLNDIMAINDIAHITTHTKREVSMLRVGGDDWVDRMVFLIALRGVFEGLEVWQDGGCLVASSC